MRKLIYLMLFMSGAIAKAEGPSVNFDGRRGTAPLPELQKVADIKSVRPADAPSETSPRTDRPEAVFGARCMTKNRSGKLPPAQWIERFFPGPRPGGFPETAPFSPGTNLPKAMIVASKGAAIVDSNSFFNGLAANDIVYVGEQHDQALHHLVQLEVLKKIHEQRPNVVIGIEMLDVTQQGALDDYLSGRMPDAEFKHFWERAWGYSFEIYRPIFEYARAERVPVKALNAPFSVVGQIAQGGLDSLTPAQRKLLPETIHPIQDPRYLDYVKQSLGNHAGSDPTMRDRMLLGMTVWNETMAESVIKALAQGGPVLVIAGSGHMLYRAGILESVRDRISASQLVVLPYPLDGEQLPLKELLSSLQDPCSADIELGDYFRLLPTQ